MMYEGAEVGGQREAAHYFCDYLIRVTTTFEKNKQLKNCNMQSDCQYSLFGKELLSPGLQRRVEKQTICFNRLIPISNFDECVPEEPLPPKANFLYALEFASGKSHKVSAQ